MDLGPLVTSRNLASFAPNSYLDQYNIRSMVVVNLTTASYQLGVLMDCGSQ